MTNGALRFFGLLLWLACSAAAARAEDCRTIHVVDHGYHTGLILAADAFDAAATLGTDAFAGAGWLQFGWGDAEFYQARDPGLSMAISALLSSRGAVLHVLGLPVAPGETYPPDRTIALGISPAGLGRIVERLRQTFVRAPGAYPVATGSSYGGRGRFYRATGDYSLAYTCNHWMAGLLAPGGVNIDPGGAALSADLMAMLSDAAPGSCHANDWQKR